MPPLTPSATLPHRAPRRLLRILLALITTLFLLTLVAALAARHWLRSAVRDSLPQTSGTLHAAGLAAPVTISRNPQGVPSVRAASLSDLYFAQGFVTAQDRLFQMDTLRRHAAGTLAEVLGASLIPHDRTQRILGLGPAADRILAQLPADQRLAMQRYADGVNAAIAATPHLPLEFRVLRYTPAPWSPRDSVLVSLVLFEELTNTFPHKLGRESIAAHLAPTVTPELRAELLADLYPVGSWRDHPPSEPTTDVTNPTEPVPDIPLDPSQTRLTAPSTSTPAGDLLALQQLLPSSDLRPGSNNWAVSGAHTASGRPLLSNDMHLPLTAPGIWYTVDLATTALAANTPFHAAGVSLPGVPFVIVGHNDHVAWGVTNLGADVQDLFIEHLRGSGASAEFLTTAGAWQPVRHRAEPIQVRNGRTLQLDVLSTVHGGVETPLLTPLLATETRPLALRWSLQDTVAGSFPFGLADAAATGADLAQAFSTYTGPTLNLIWADDGNHIGYHSVGRIPIRGSLASPTPLAPAPIDTAAADAATHEWTGFIPYNQLPATVDPTGGVLATANSRITPGNGPTDNYPFPVTLDWVSPYRTERIWHQLAGRTGLQPADMLHLQTDILSASDKLIAHRLAYAIDHTPDDHIRNNHGTPRQLREAADLLRDWDGEVRPDTPAPLLVGAARDALWTLLLSPKLSSIPTTTSTSANSPRQSKNSNPDHTADLLAVYQWFERDFAQEQLIAHLPARWLPPTFRDWEDLLSTAVIRGLSDLHAPRHPASLRYGHIDPATGAPAESNLELALFAQSRILSRLFGLPTGSGHITFPGNGRTVWQSHQNFGPSERLIVDLAHPNDATLVLPMGESGNPLSPFFRDQLPAYLHGATFPLPFAPAIYSTPSTLTLQP